MTDFVTLSDVNEAYIIASETVGADYIVGPGEAKIELRKEIEKRKEFASKKLHVETADKMTEKQIKARVRQFFARYIQ